MKMRQHNWMALVGMILVSGGLASAAFSNPPNDLNDPRAADRQALLLGVSGFACTIAGTVLLLIVAGKTTKSMAPEKKTSTNICVGIGIILQLAGFLVYRVGVVVGHPLVAPLLLIVPSVPVFAWGCVNYVDGKGRSKWFGLVGVMGLVGLAILMVLPEQYDGDGGDPSDAGGDARDVASQVPEI